MKERFWLVQGLVSGKIMSQIMLTTMDSEAQAKESAETIFKQINSGAKITLIEQHDPGEGIKANLRDAGQKEILIQAVQDGIVDWYTSNSRIERPSMGELDWLLDRITRQIAEADAEFDSVNFVKYIDKKIKERMN